MEIKAAYRSLAKVCHPDFLGEKGHNICILLNEVRPLCYCIRLLLLNPWHTTCPMSSIQAYETLSSPKRRAAYNLELEQALLDSSDGYTGLHAHTLFPSSLPSLIKVRRNLPPFASFRCRQTPQQMGSRDLHGQE